MKLIKQQGWDHTLYEPMTRGCAAKLKALDRVGRLWLLTNQCLYCTTNDVCEGSYDGNEKTSPGCG